MRHLHIFWLVMHVNVEVIDAHGGTRIHCCFANVIPGPFKLCVCTFVLILLDFLLYEQ